VLIPVYQSFLPQLLEAGATKKFVVIDYCCFHCYSVIVIVLQ